VINKESLNLINSFSQILAIENGLAKNTICAYQNDLKLFLKFLESKHSDFLKVDENLFKLYLENLHEEGITTSSLNRKISTFKHFFKFLDLESLKKDNPTTNISQAKSNQKLPKCLSENEIFSLFQVLDNDPTPFGIRLKCMLEILYASGLRVSELVELPISAIGKYIKSEKTYLKNYLIINGKGKKERIAPLNKASLKILEKYLDLRQDLGHKDSKWLFCGQVRINKGNNNIKSSRKIVGDKHITRQRFHQMLKELAVKANIDKTKVSPHIIRHSFASHLLNQGIDLRVLQELLGHSDISTTQIYTHILDSKLKDLVYQNHPLIKS
jgi:integrase/recombinase XerD